MLAGAVARPCRAPPRRHRRAAAGTPAGSDRSAPMHCWLRGHDLLDRSDLAAAIIEYELAVELDSTRADPHMYLGIALYLNGADRGRRCTSCAQRLFSTPSCGRRPSTLAVCHEALGQARRSRARIPPRGARRLALERRHAAPPQRLASATCSSSRANAVRVAHQRALPARRPRRVFVSR